jgi:hypothetical protein
LTFPTSTGEVLKPCGSDLIFVLPDKLLGDAKMVWLQAAVLCQLDTRL